MGLSSSQARLLHLTARMHQIEYKAAKVEAMKLQMANESRRAYEEYLDAIDVSKIQYKILTTDASVTHTDANYNALCFGQAGDRYALLSPYTDEVFVNSDIQTAFENFPSSPAGFATSLTGYTPPTTPTVIPPTVPYDAPEVEPQDDNTDINLVRTDSSQNGASETIKAGNTINMTLDNIIEGSGTYGYTITTLDSSSDADISVQYLDNGRVVISGNNLSITANGGQNDDIILLGSNNKLVTGDGNDIIRVAQCRDSEGIYSGVSENNIIDSGSGNDHVTVYYKNNKLIDGDGVDVLYANSTVAGNTNTSSASVSSAVNVSSNSGINSQTLDTIEGCAAQTNANDCRLFTLINSLGGNNNNGNLSSYVTISTNSSGGYNVKFNKYNGSGVNNIDVTKSEIANYDGVSGDLTTALIDYALNKIMYLNKDDDRLSSGATDSTNAFSRADYQTVSKYFFGNTNFGMYNADWGDDVKTGLINIWKDYSAHTNNVTNISLTFASDNAALGIHSGHAYSVKNLVLNSDNSIKYIEVINPWDDADVVRLDGNTLNSYIGSVYTFGSPAYNIDAIVQNANSSLTAEAPEYIVPVNSTAADNEWYYYYNLHQEIVAHGMILISDDNAKSSTWLTNAVNGGFAYLKVLDTKEEVLVDTSVAVNTSLQEIQDETLLRKAEAKYEADMKRIDLKDRRYDTDLAAIESERNAIKQEMETLKTVIKDNVERTFKLFS